MLGTGSIQPSVAIWVATLLINNDKITELEIKWTLLYLMLTNSIRSADIRQVRSKMLVERFGRFTAFYRK